MGILKTTAGVLTIVANEARPVESVQIIPRNIGPVPHVLRLCVALSSTLDVNKGVMSQHVTPSHDHMIQHHVTSFLLTSSEYVVTLLHSSTKFYGLRYKVPPVSTTFYTIPYTCSPFVYKP
jgi:hypothetical protein